MIGATLAIVLYACVLMGKKGEENGQSNRVNQVAER